MWGCPNCNESVEDDFDICWNCGSTREGTIVANFARESDKQSAGSESVAEPSLEAGSGMTRRELAALVCKTLALVMFAQAAFLSITGILLFALTLTAAPFRGWLDWDQLQAYLILSVPMLAALAVGLVYWKRSDAIASRMVSASIAPVTELPISVEDVMVVAFSTAGVFILVDGIRDAVAVIIVASRYDFTRSELWYNVETAAAWVQVGFALWLVLGSRGIVRAIRWLRTAGGPEPDGSEDKDAP